VLGRVDGDAQICDLVVIDERAHVGGRTVLCGDEVVRGEERGKLEPCRSGVSRAAAIGPGRQTL
jgi:hypothetical protein